MQAVVILAHKDVQQVVNLASKLNEKFEVYIHFDKKINVDSQVLEKLKNMGVKYYSEIYVNWGGWSIGEAAVRMMKHCLKNPNIEYIHLISGQDWPIKNLDDIYQRFDGNNKIYMSYEKAKSVTKSGENLIWWQKYYFNYDKVMRRTLFGKFYHRFLILFQKLLGINKIKKLGIDLEIYTGANWVDLPRNAAEYSVKYLENHPNLLKMLQTGAFSDEFWLQTILCNSPLKECIVNKTLRHINWTKKHGSRPAILDEEDYENIKNSDAIFARKFDKDISKELIQKIEDDSNIY